MRFRFFFGAVIVYLCIPAVIQAQDWLPKRIVGMEYPPLAAQARIQGTVELNCLINENGFVESTKIESVSGPVLERGIRGILSEAAQNNVKGWKFARSSPAPGATPSTVTIKYFFKLVELEGCPQRKRWEEFAFEYPDSVFVTSDTPCLQP